MIYKDTWLKVAGSLLASYTIDSMGRTESIFERLTKSYFYVDIFFGFLIAITLWETIKRCTVFLDRKYSWIDNTLERFLLQFLLGIILPTIICFLLVSAFMHFVWNQNIFETEWLYNELYTVILVIVLINLMYFSWWLYLGLHRSEPISLRTNGSELLPTKNIPDPQPSVAEEAYIDVTKGAKKILLPHSDILFINLIDGYTYIQSSNGETYVSTNSLDDFTRLLCSKTFFRANRQNIIHRKAFSSYQSIENGKIKTFLNTQQEVSIIISQKKAKAFRKWILRKGK